MASANLLALIDDIATLLDDVAVMTKVAAKKTAGVLGDDLAVNAEQVSGVQADRELPVVWAVFKGSMLNKLILVPAALLISAFIPWAVTPLLMVGGAFLCYEGFEKVFHYFFHNKDDEHKQEFLEAVKNQQIDLIEFEKQKIKGAVRTDFILSAEIIAITLGTVATAPIQTQVVVVSVIAVVMTIGVYGIVAGIVKLDDAGLFLSKKPSPWRQIGLALVAAAPYLMKTLTVLGTIAMFIVGGGILVHGLPFMEHLLEQLPDTTAMNLVHHILPTLFGILAGGLLVAAHHLISLIRK